MDVKISFRVKEHSACPICNAKHNREELLSGRGRLIAGKLTQELRREYKPSIKYGIIYPLAYVVQTCPSCYYSSYPKDFHKIAPTDKEKLQKTILARRELIYTLFGNLNFAENRNLVLGLASLVLSVDCYHLRDKKIVPTPKKAFTCLRAAWLFDDLYKYFPKRPYDKARDFYYTEAIKNYEDTLEIMQTGREAIDSMAHTLGPDLDHNWGYEGIIYINAYLTKKYYHQLANSKQEKYELLEKVKRNLSRIYGMGKSNKEKPSVIVDMSKDLFDEIAKILKSMNNDAEEKITS